MSCPGQRSETHTHTHLQPTAAFSSVRRQSGSQRFGRHDFNSQQLTRQNPRTPRARRAQAARKLRASTRSPSKTSRHLLCRMSLSAQFKQWIGCRNMHSPCFRLCPSCVAEPAAFSVGSRICCWPRTAGSNLSGKRGLLCDTLLRKAHAQSTRKLLKPRSTKSSFCVAVRVQVRAQVRAKDPIPGKRI